MLANYIKGKQDGIQTRYYENGQVKRVENLKTGNLLMENVLKKMD
jgi:protein TonB